MLDKSYQPRQVEQRIYKMWESAGLFAAGQSSVPWTVMMPPPNVTGSLHMGHAVNMTLQDVLTRYYRMCGRDALWQPGTDHAGIATQMVVERQLAVEGNDDRRVLGRDAFVQRVWQWKEESGGTIVEQLRRLGASPDWKRERFTLDQGLSRAVRLVFVSLYREGLIYRDKRLVNWDCELLTAISDLEVEQRQVEGHLWYLRYPIEDDSGAHITVATTRPETMFGDTGVAVHPDDDKYRHLIGKFVTLPLVGRRIEIIADKYSDPDKGTGAVKITPAHDFNDFEVGRRHGLEAINILDERGFLNENVPVSYQCLDRFEARDKVVADLKAQDLLEDIEDHIHAVPFGDRSNTVIEPWLTDQWYVDAKTLAKPAIEAVECGRTQFVPKNWENTYFEWMRNIQPWCISRQLWWGHRIPAWYGPNGNIFVAMDETEAVVAAEREYGCSVDLVQDEDVLDTWFSSALWPFSTLGWPDTEPEVERHYPGDVLVTGFDIIFFWVARMMMMGLHFMKDVPFREIYIHALVRDEKGQKMSKSKGNIIDPVILMNKYGTDALRFTLTAMAAQGRDIKLSEQRVAGYRNFVTKLWNASRFGEMNECNFRKNFIPEGCKLAINRWIVGGTVETVSTVSEGIESYRFNEAADALYHFIWGTFCDWYLELIKPVLYGEDGPQKEETRAVFGWVLMQILRMLHPVTPFVTEELYQKLGDKEDLPLMSQRWPDVKGLSVDGEAKDELNWVVRLVSEIRSVRATMNVPPSAKIGLFYGSANESTVDKLKTHDFSVCQLARLSTIEEGEGASNSVAQIILDETTLFLALGGVIDVSIEKARLQKEITKLVGEAGKIRKKLSNEEFLAQAPSHVIEKQRERLLEADQSRHKLEEAVGRLSSV